jgi:hypothetical protein
MLAKQTKCNKNLIAENENQANNKKLTISRVIPLVPPWKRRQKFGLI